MPLQASTMSFSKFYVIVLTAFLFLSSRSDAACPKTCNCVPIPQQNFPGECCKPGSLQYNDTDVPSFCTDKPFESGYTMKIDEKVPVQINLVDYCTDQIIFSSFVAPQVDRFSVANFPCSFQPASCSEVPTADQASCQAGEKVWTDTLGCTSLDVQKLLNSRICNSTNYPGKTGDYVWVDASPGDRVILPTVGYCNCNWKKRFSELNGTGLTNVTKGVPNGYIKEGMSTFYVQVMIGGRSTSANDDPTCQCASPWDVSPECEVETSHDTSHACHQVCAPLEQGKFHTFTTIRTCPPSPPLFPSRTDRYAITLFMNSTQTPVSSYTRTHMCDTTSRSGE